MRPCISLGSLVVVVVLSTLPAHAHHSFGGTYNVDQKITIKGKIAQVTLRSPHSFLYVEVENGDGSVDAGRSKARRPVNSHSRGSTRMPSRSAIRSK